MSEVWNQIVIWATSVALALLIGWIRVAYAETIGSNTARFVGSAQCAACHQREDRLWNGSHHQLAMQPASDSTVLGNFDHATFDKAGVRSTFFRKGSKFFVRTQGPDGGLRDYQISYTFGVYPLQQYLIAMPPGRLQALGIAWDSRPHTDGGQRWFFLYPGEKVGIHDSRYWTGIDQNWNYMCADCHSTNLRKNYDERTRTYTTVYSEIDVSCEACHGPGSEHVAWAKREGDWKTFANEGLTIALDERKQIGWSINPETGNATRSAPRQSEHEIQMCARCHSRRGQIHEDYVHGQPVGDDYRVALLDQGLYFPDGQIKEEDYEYGSFIQSRMFHAGVTCSDCHEPHSSKLRAAGNALCAQCHLPQKYDSPAHHFHKEGSAGSRCVECHMPTRTYMVVDMRRDHSIRIPRPDLSVKIGTPNACTNCHTDKSARWADDILKRRYDHPAEGFQRFAETLHDGSLGAPGSQQSLERLVKDRAQPAIARASALSMLSEYSPTANNNAVRAGIEDDSPLVRRAAAHALSNSDPSQNAIALAPLLSDPVRSVRVETVEVTAGARDIPAELAASLAQATDEYVHTQQLNADRPESHLDLGILYAKEQRPVDAEAEFKTALLLDPGFTPAAVNLADLYRVQKRDDLGAQALNGALQRTPNDPSIEHALGLLMIRQKRLAPALDLLRKAADGAPDNARYAYVYAVALNDMGRSHDAIEVLETSIRAHPYDRNSLEALVMFLEKSGQSVQASQYAQRLNQLDNDTGAGVNRWR